MSKPLFLFIRVDARGNKIPGSGVLRQKMPKIGRWTSAEDVNLCCQRHFTTTTTTTTSSTTTTTTTVGG